MTDDGEFVSEYEFPDGRIYYIKYKVKWIRPKAGYDYSLWTNGGNCGSFRTLEETKEKIKEYASQRMKDFIDDNMPIIEGCQIALEAIKHFDWIEKYRSSVEKYR